MVFYTMIKVVTPLDGQEVSYVGLPNVTSLSPHRPNSGSPPALFLALCINPRRQIALTAEQEVFLFLYKEQKYYIA